MPKITKVRDFTRENDYNAFSVVRMYNRHVSEFGGRHAWVRIQNQNVTIYRRARGAGSSTGLPHDAIELDYDSRLELGLAGPPDPQGFYTCNLTMEAASSWDKLKAHWSHPSEDYRVTYRLAMLSVVLGLVGFFLGIVSLIK